MIYKNFCIVPFRELKRNLYAILTLEHLYSQICEINNADETHRKNAGILSMREDLAEVADYSIPEPCEEDLIYAN